MKTYPILTELEDVERIKKHENIIFFCCEEEYYLPKLKEEGSAGYDIGIRKKYNQIDLGIYKKFGTGLKVRIPVDYKLLVLPRSSMFDKIGAILVNSPGLIDSSYRGEIIGALFFIKPQIWEDSSRHLQCFDESNQRIDFFQLVISISITHRTIPSLIAINPTIVGIVNKEVYDNFDVLFPSKRGTGAFGSTDNLFGIKTNDKL